MSDSSGWLATYVGLQLIYTRLEEVTHQVLDSVYISTLGSPGSSEAFNFALQDYLLQAVALSPADVAKVVEGLLVDAHQESFLVNFLQNAVVTTFGCPWNF